MGNTKQERRKRGLLVLSGVMLSVLTSMLMMLHLNPAEPEPQPQPVSPPDKSLKNIVDIARANLSHNVLEANYAVGRMNINGINTEDCFALSAANRQVRINADFVRANTPTLLADKKITSYEAEDMILLMNDITEEQDAPRLVTEQRCLSLK